jgi:hypothetical protein
MRGDDARRRVVSPASENIFSIPERRDALETLARAVENESAATTTTTRGFDTSRAVATPARDDDETTRARSVARRQHPETERGRGEFWVLTRRTTRGRCERAGEGRKTKESLGRHEVLRVQDAARG